VAKVTVGVLIPCHNHAGYVSRALDSALSQTWPPDEVVVVDDGSTDGSVSILERFADRIRLEARNNHGIGATYNRLIELSSANVLAFLESDDALKPTYLETCLRFMEEHRVDWVCTARQVIDPDDNPTGIIVRKHTRGPRYTTEGILGRDIGLANTPVVRREALLDVGPFPTIHRGAVDVDMSLRFSTRHAMGYLDEPLYLYRRHETNVSGESLRDSREILDILRRFQQSEWARSHPAAARKALARFAGRVASLGIKAEPPIDRQEVLDLLAEARRYDPWNWRHLRRQLTVRWLGVGVARASPSRWRQPRSESKK